MRTKTVSASYKAVGDSGEVTAIVSVFGNQDAVGDVVDSHAFDDWIARAKAKGNPIACVWSHQWGNPDSIIGQAPISSVKTTPEGLQMTFRLDVAENPTAAQVFRLIKSGTINNYSFAYDVKAEQRQKDGSNLLQRLDVLEAGPCLRGANSDTRTLDVKNSGACPEHADCLTDGTKHWQKVGARNSASDLAAIQRIHDDALGLGADCSDDMKAARLRAIDFIDWEGRLREAV